MTTTFPEDNEASKPGVYNYMQLLNEWKLVDSDAEWMQWSACKDLDPKIFFPESNYKNNYVKAKAVCAECIVYKDCMRFALVNSIDHGVWGGLSPLERIRKRRSDKNAAGK